MSNRVYSLDNDSVDEEVRQATSQGISVKECILCHKKFVPKGRNAWRQNKCTRIHAVKCSWCGKEIILNCKKLPSKDELSTGCCKSCSTHLKITNSRKSMQEKYGEDVVNAGQVPGSRNKAVSTMKKNGTFEVIAKKNKDIWKKKSKEEIDDIIRKRKDTSFIRWGVDNPSKNENIKRIISKTNSSDSVIQRYTRTSLSHYGTRRPAQTQTYMNNRVGKYSTEDGRPLDSSWELIFYNFLRSIGMDDCQIDRNVPLEYTINDENHFTFVDFKVNGILFEVKNSAQLLKVFKHNRGMDKKIPVYRDNNVVLVTDSKASDIFDDPIHVGTVHDGHLTGVDISLFSNDRKFPDNLNRPDCFYKVNVDGNKSSYDAFFDNSIVWKMVLNRIKYRGGFISGKEVVRAMSVTRTCKQPSWFSKAYARQLISKYCTSSTVVDPFAGWGTRAEACRELHKSYIGIDANVESVNWNREHFRYVQLGDVETFTYDKPCSVFTCPPYKNKEVYFYGMKNKSACEWMKIVINNIPNAIEYVFVCDEVEGEFADFVVETKKNKSHLGSNNEYVVNVPNSSRYIFLNE